MVVNLSRVVNVAGRAFLVCLDVQIEIKKRFLQIRSFSTLILENVTYDPFTKDVNKLATTLRNYAASKSLREGKLVHHHIVKCGLGGDRFLANLLMQMYGKCGALHDARAIFDNMQNKNIYSWNIMIGAYIQMRLLKEAQDLFYQMPDRDIISWTLMISTYAQEGHMKEAYKLFSKMTNPSVITWNVMISGYAKQGKIANALQLFEHMPNRNVISWTAMISACVQHGQMEAAFHLFEKMPQRDVMTWNTMIAGYANQNKLDDANFLFQKMPCKDVVSWTTMISAYSKQGHLNEAVELFNKMPFRDLIAWNAMIAGYAQEGKLNEALSLFEQMPKKNVVSWNTMLTAYCRQGHLPEALEFFQKMPFSDVVSWNSMISGYGQQGQLKSALHLFREMLSSYMKPDYVTFISILDACASQAGLTEGKEIHSYMIATIRAKYSVLVDNALVNMYAKCGCLADSCGLFDNMPERDLVSWNVLLAAFGDHGLGNECLHVFGEMKLEGIVPDRVTFLNILSACSQASLLDEGCHYLVSICESHRITTTLEHYDCIVVLIGRTVQLDVAESVINCMPWDADPLCWRVFST